MSNPPRTPDEQYRILDTEMALEYVDDYPIGENDIRDSSGTPINPDEWCWANVWNDEAGRYEMERDIHWDYDLDRLCYSRCIYDKKIGKYKIVSVPVD